MIVATCGCGSVSQPRRRRFSGADRSGRPAADATSEGRTDGQRDGGAASLRKMTCHSEREAAPRDGRRRQFVNAGLIQNIVSASGRKQIK